MSAATTSSWLSLHGIDPSSHRVHPLHGADRTYAETNCYTDVLIELLHAHGREPLAALGSTLRVDFEGDQWTFFKPLDADLRALFGLDIHEMQPYRALPAQIAEQLLRGRTLIVEVDSFYLPDTASTSYRREHVKTSIAIEAIDRTGEILHYFHGSGLFALGDEDYRGVFRLGRPLSEDVLPPYVELARFDAEGARPDHEVREVARELLRGHLAARPQTNPFESFGRHLQDELPRLLAADAQTYHDYAFATARMTGSAFEVAASHVSWVLGDAAGEAPEAFARVVELSRILSLRLARRREFDPAPILTEMAERWQTAMEILDARIG